MLFMRLLPCAFLLLAAASLPAQTTDLTAAEIMARVAANQDTGDIERARYVYLQHIRIASRKGKTVQCEEVTDARVTPGTAGSQQTLLKLDGRVLVDKGYRTYDQPPPKRVEDRYTTPDPDESGISRPERQARREARKKYREEHPDDPMDQDLVENLRKNLTNEKSKDGFHAGLFPLTGKAQSQYDFVLKGHDRRNGRNTFHITFTPKDKSDYSWRGDAWIDTEAFQPVVVQTALSKNIPLAVRMLLGTSVPGLGFSVTYAPQIDGTWFPVSFGSEFKINVLFFFHRSIAIAAENRDFQKTHVDSRILPEASPE